MKVASYDVVFQEVPGEVTLALNISGCPCHCKGCHSPHLWEDTGEPLDEMLIDGLLDRYGGLATCVAFMGGDQDPEYVFRLARHVHEVAKLHTAWYSGRMKMPEGDNALTLDFVKLGGYVEALGGLKSKNTNQRLYKRVGNEWQDITEVFHHSAFDRQ